MNIEEHQIPSQNCKSYQYDSLSKTYLFATDNEIIIS